MDWVKILIAVGIMVVLGALMGLLLALADKKLSVAVDERVGHVQGMLPGVNCGGCGYPGCSQFAKALVNGEQKQVSGCIVAKREQHQAIADYLNETPGPDGEITKVTV